MDQMRRELRIRAATRQVEEEPLGEEPTLKKILSDKNITKHIDRFNFSPIPLCPRAYRELPV